MKRRVFLRACPRCGGDMIVTDDAFSRFGPYWSCFQCGHTRDLLDPQRPHVTDRAPEEMAETAEAVRSRYMATKSIGPHGRRGPKPKGLWKACVTCGVRFYVRRSMEHYQHCSTLCVSLDPDVKAHISAGRRRTIVAAVPLEVVTG